MRRGKKFQSPLAEGRELKYRQAGYPTACRRSPLAEGRELKYGRALSLVHGQLRRPSRRGVN